MAIKLINDDILQDIAEAIQEKDNGNKMTADQMASRISNLTTGNYGMEDGLVTRALSVYENSRVTTVGSKAFYSCDSLTSVSFPQVTSIGDSAFYACPKLASINFPQATTIGSWAFTSCFSFISISFPLVTTIENMAFTTCPQLTSVNFPQTISIGQQAFGNCYSLASVSFPQATIIGDRAFWYCSKLTSISFPQTISIGSSAFQGCRSLTSVVLGGQQSQEGIIYTSAFYRCPYLTDLYLQGSYLYLLFNSDAFTSTPIADYSASAGKYGSIYVPASSYDQYISATNWAYFSSRFVSV